mgnify:FL=1
MGFFETFSTAFQEGPKRGKNVLSNERTEGKKLNLGLDEIGMGGEVSVEVFF